jgi:BirA family biotin operon repressor/biotin-[acetyl-CoA-carboxylase] ligase
MKLKDEIFRQLLSNRDVYLSGEQLAEKLGISRNAVWKAVKQLQAEGYDINAVTNRGYQLGALPDMLNAGVIRIGLENAPETLTLEVKDSISSTNTFLKEHSSSYATHDHLLIANEQTEGRGRMGRSFHSPASGGIYMSYLLHPQISASEALYLTTSIAAATARAIEDVCGISAKIKWVNDIIVNSRKACGILTEAVVNFETGGLEYAIVGIGINVEEPEDGYPDDIKNVAGALYRHGEVPEGIKNKLVAAITDYFYEYYNSINEKTFLEEYKKRSCIVGEEIDVIDNIFEPGKRVRATALSIDDECHLVVKYENGSTGVLSSGEVSVRKR